MRSHFSIATTPSPEAPVQQVSKSSQSGSRRRFVPCRVTHDSCELLTQTGFACASPGLTTVGDGIHERMVVNVSRFDMRVQDKITQVGGRK
jgi:hypothetical protein